MRFRPFGKIRTKASGLPPGGPWVALEKVHGAQLVVGFDRRTDTVLVGKRKAWLDAGQAFFGWQLLASELSNAIRHWAAALEAPQLVAYGELFGGAYPHPEVPPVAGLSPIQTGVWYHPGLRWSPFDLLICQDNDDDGVFVSYSELAALVADSGFPPPPLVARGPRGDLLTLPVAAPTRLPARFGLPEVADNIAEGLVLRPDRRGAPGSRGLLKRKIETFDDARFKGAQAFDPGQALALADLLAWARRLTNPARVASARSKVGTDPDDIVEEVVLDVLVDLEEAFPAAVSFLKAEDQSDLEKVILDELSARALLSTACR